MSDSDVTVDVTVPDGVSVEVNVNGVSVGTVTARDSDGGEAELSCRECEWSAGEEEAPEVALDFLTCPECSGNVESV